MSTVSATALTGIPEIAAGADLGAILAAALAPLGVTVEPRRSAALDREALVLHVLHESCDAGSVGFWTEADHLRLDSNDSCEALSHSPLVDAVLGHDLIGDAEAAFDAVAIACRDHAPVAFSYRGRPVGPGRCERPLGDHPLAWTVTRTPAP